MRSVAGGAVALVIPLSLGMARFDVGGLRASAEVSRGPQESAQSLRSLLLTREAELEALRFKVHELEKAAEKELYREAETLGIVREVTQSGLPARQQRRIAIAIIRESKQNGLDPLLVVALIRSESSFDNYARSKVGALGLMQVMPETGRWIASMHGLRLTKKTHLFDSELNLEIGTAYLANLIRRFGGLDAALVAYNAGPSAAHRILADRAAKARFLAGYPRKVVLEFRRLKAKVDVSERDTGKRWRA